MERFLNKIICGDCLEVMKEIPDKSVDMILCDLPYGTTACPWDVIIPFDPLWRQYKRLIKSDGAIVLFANQPFTTDLIISGRNLFKYTLVWEKTLPSNRFHAKLRPLKTHEDICVFSIGTIANCSQRNMKYYPQGLIEVNQVHKRPQLYETEHHWVRPSHKTEYVITHTGYPGSVLKYSNGNNHNEHPTQKPVPLFEYLIKTYTNEKEIVLDNCIGSGTTAIAAHNTGRFFIGIEKEPKYCEIARKRVEQAQMQQSLF